MGESIGSARATPAAQTLAGYRTRLMDLLMRAESCQREDAEIHFAVSRLVDRLSLDLIDLYDDLARGALAQADRVTVLPALELMREVLRHAWRRPRPLHDMLHEALAPMPSSPA
jgi:hypothetical protein